MSERVFKNPRFDALRCALYHAERRAFLDLLNRGLNFIVILLGASAAANWAKLVHLDQTWIELGIVLFATMQLVFNFGGAARTHEFLQRQYYGLLAEIETSDDPEDRRWSAKIITITADEPMTMRALDALAYNKALDALYAEPERSQFRQQVSPWQYRLRHFRAYQSVNFFMKEKPGV